jgi:hypothetical protein
MDMHPLRNFVILVKPTFTINVGQTLEMGALLCGLYVSFEFIMWLLFDGLDVAFVSFALFRLLFLAMVIVKTH